MKRRSFVLLAFLGVATITAGAYYARRGDAPPVLTTDAVSRGSVVPTVSATGTLQAVTTVEVGSQVSGILEALPVDFNAIVHKGELLARLDQSTFQTAVEQAQAGLVSAEADAERLRVTEASDDVALARARDLSSRELIPAADLQDAQTEARDAAAQVTGADARVKQARAALETAQVNLSKTVITSPIDGVVIARNVDVGQTVSASFSAPTLFVIAADLTRLRLNANIDESDVGQVSQGQPVTFRVDAYPEETFRGTVSQVRLNPATLNNVVTYDALVDAPNPDLKLKPGMTATLGVEVARRDDVLRVPAAALRFKPDATLLAQLGVRPAAAAAKAPTVWISESGTLTPVTVTPGLSDGTFTELLNPPFADGARVVTRIAASGASSSPVPARPSGNAGNPLLPTGRFGR